MLLSLVFSFRNEEENIRELVRRVSESVKSVQDLEYELVFVNDRSTDNSLDLLLSLRKDYPIRIVNMSCRFGVTPCLLAGLAHSSQRAGREFYFKYLDKEQKEPITELISEAITLTNATRNLGGDILLERIEGWKNLWRREANYKRGYRPTRSAK